MITDDGPSILRLANFVNGYPFKPHDLSGSRMPVIRIRQLLDPTVKPDLTDVDAPWVKVNDGDIVFSWSATLAVRRWNRGEALLNQHLFRVDPNSSVYPSWIAYVLEAACWRLEPLMHGSAMTHVTKDMLRRVRVRAPSMPAQRKIADFLDSETGRIDALIDKKRKMLRLLDTKWQATISNWLWNGSPYQRVRLRHLAGRPTSGNRDHSFSFSDNGVPCLRGINVKPAKIVRRDLYKIDERASQEHTATILRAGDLVIVRSGFAGAAALVPSDLDGANCVDLVVVRKCSAIVPKYLEYVVNSREAQEQVRYGSSGALLTHFNAVDAGNLAIPVRNIATQKAIVEELDSRFEKVEMLRSLLGRQIDLLREHRQALITAAVTGEMEVPGVA